MIAPYMPLAMCWITGGTPQWYMNTPGNRATQSKVAVFPGSTGW
jgi:hypothetical protein